jgi:iron complex outermembrane receptor protein
MNYTLSQDPQTAIDAYTIVNLSAGVRDSAGRWQVLGYVNNLFNEHYFSNLTNSFGNFGNNLATQSYLPRDFKRYYGLRASYDF